MPRNRGVYLVLVAVVIGISSPVGSVGVAAADDCSFPTTSTDATGTEVTVSSEPERIVTLNPSAAQTMWEIGAKDKVVGLSDYGMYLDGAENRTDIWAETHVNVEEVVNLTPDLVLAPNVIPNSTVNQLRTAGVTVYKFETAISTGFITEKTRLTGELVGECDGANDRAAQLDDEVETIREAASGVDRPRVLYVFFGWTAGEDTFIDMIITTAGGRNVAAEAGISGYKKISEEVVVERDPEWIVVNTDNPEVPDSDAYDQTTAVKEGNIVTVDANYISQPAPRIVEPMLTIIKELHPEAYEEAKEGVEQVRDDEEDDEPPPSFEIASASMAVPQTASEVTLIELHETVTIRYTVTNSGGPGTFKAGLYLNESVKEFDFTEIDSNESGSDSMEYTFGALGRYTVSINDHRVADVEVVKNLTKSLRVADTGATNATGPMAANASASATATPSPTATEPPTQTPNTANGSDASPTGTEPPGSQSGSSTGTASATTAPVETMVQGATITQTPGQPGFGVGVGIGAVLLVVLLVRRGV